MDVEVNVSRKGRALTSSDEEDPGVQDFYSPLEDYAEESDVEENLEDYDLGDNGEENDVETPMESSNPGRNVEESDSGDDGSEEVWSEAGEQRQSRKKCQERQEKGW